MKKLILILMSTLLLLSPALGSEGPATDQDIKDFTSQYIDLLNQSLADLEVKEEILDYYH